MTIDPVIKQWAEIVRRRSKDHSEAMRTLYPMGNRSVVFSILRLELDSLIRVFYLLTLPESERSHLIAQTLDGAERWRGICGKVLTDRAMLDASREMIGWEQLAYQFGCAFVHLSALHGGLDVEVAKKLGPQDQKYLRGYIRQYHGVEISNEIRLSEIYDLAPSIFSKISSNMLHQLNNLENGGGFDG